MWAVAVIAVVMTPAGAGATAGVEVIDLDTQEHCGEVTVVDHVVSGGCELSATSEGGPSAPSIEVLQHAGLSETVISTCYQELDVHVNEEGHGYVANQVLAGDECGLEACDEPTHEELPWEFQIGELLNGHVALGMTFCVRPPDDCVEGENTIQPCAVVADVVETAPHEYEIETTGAPCVDGPSTELRGHWVLDASEIEIQG